ncbi:hypothetical protein [Ornithinibacillus sp. 179-J 7C1 HS]|uniref:hypothetical protein n=1 Tax=Ornithinibacillus sp. 179-J 7C1 HS TaxID=3142384 RepID=UPI0039A0C4FE
MKKLITLLVLLTVTGQFYYANIDGKHENQLFTQEYEAPTNSSSADFSPFSSGDGKLKISFTLFGTFLVFVSILSLSCSPFVLMVKRRTVLCPKFYQANYLVHSPLK